MEKPFGIEALQDRLDHHPASFVVVLSGPAGAGKTSIRQGLLERDNNLRRCVTTTTRAKRHNETDGIDYHFVSEDAFRSGLKQGCFLEWAEVYGFLYGATFEAIAHALVKGGVVLLVVDVQGTAAWKRLLKERCVSVFVLPPSVKALEERLGRRNTEAPGAMKHRLEIAKNELVKAAEFDYMVVNKDLDRAVSEVQELIRAERHRPWRTPGLLVEYGYGNVP